MKFQPNPLLYGAGEDFLTGFRLAITLREAVDHGALTRAVANATVRYPYFCVTPVREGETLFLAFNPRPVPVFADGRCAVLGSEESNGHLLTFGCQGDRIFLNGSHCLADGVGVDPLLKTVLYLYLSEQHGEEGLATDRIPMPDGPVLPEEYAYPFPAAPVELGDGWRPKSVPQRVCSPDPRAFDGKGLYAYHLRIPQRAMMAKANTSDGSPVSFLTVMMYRAVVAADGPPEHPVAVHVQRQYRAALHAPLSRHSLVRYIPVVLPPKAMGWSVEMQNTAVRGQVILESEEEADLYAVNRLLAAFPREADASLAEKKRAMGQFLKNSIRGKTCGISYVGRMDWCGLDRYVEDIHVYIGEKHTQNMLLMEVMTVGEDFSVNLMQSGKGSRYVDALIQQLQGLEIPVTLCGEERYALSETRL